MLHDTLLELIMESITQKIKKNIQKGTFWKKAPTAFKNRVIKEIKSLNFIYFFDKGRILTKRYQGDIKKINSNHFRAGNYYIDSRVPISEKSIIYSLGILSDISFDLYLQKTYGCKIFMYDPTPVSRKFMEKHKENKLLKYTPVGVWTKNTTLKFYEPKHGGSFSVVEHYDTSKYFNAKCLTIESIMKKNNHKKISIFKADIEGAALHVLNQMVLNRIYPDQIIVEFERPKKNISKINAFFNNVSDLRSKLNNAGYEEYLLPRNKARYYALEMLFVKKIKINYGGN